MNLARLQAILRFLFVFLSHLDTFSHSLLPSHYLLTTHDHLIMPFGTVYIMPLKQHRNISHDLVDSAVSTLLISVDRTKGLRLWHCECEHTHQWSRNWRGVWWGKAHRRWTWVWERFMETVHATFHCYYQL